MDIARSEAVEKDLDAMIRRRHDKRRQSEPERAIEEVWRESERRHAAQMRERNRWLWIRYFERLARSLHERAEHCERRAKELAGVAPERQARLTREEQV